MPWIEITLNFEDGTEVTGILDPNLVPVANIGAVGGTRITFEQRDENGN